MNPSILSKKKGLIQQIQQRPQDFPHLFILVLDYGSHEFTFNSYMTLLQRMVDKYHIILDILMRVMEVKLHHITIVMWRK